MEFGVFPEYDHDVPAFRLNGWRELAKQAMKLHYTILRNGGTKGAPYGDATDAINRRCDAWIIEYVDNPNRHTMMPPHDLKTFITARVLKACLVCRYNEQTGVPSPPFFRENFRKEILELLIDAWYAERYKDEVPDWSQREAPSEKPVEPRKLDRRNY